MPCKKNTIPKKRNIRGASDSMNISSTFICNCCSRPLDTHLPNRQNQTPMGFGATRKSIPKTICAIPPQSNIPRRLPCNAGRSRAGTERLSCIRGAIPALAGLNDLTSSNQPSKGSGPNRLGPSVPFRNPHSTRAQSPPIIGMKLINTHQPDLSRSCHRLICTIIPTMTAGNINRLRTVVTKPGTDSDSERKPTRKISA